MNIFIFRSSRSWSSFWARCLRAWTMSSPTPTGWTWRVSSSTHCSRQRHSSFSTACLINSSSKCSLVYGSCNHGDNMSMTLVWGILFFLNCFFGGPEAPFVYLFSSAAPQRIAYRRVPYHPRWQPIQGLAVHCIMGYTLHRESTPYLLWQFSWWRYRNYHTYRSVLKVPVFRKKIDV